MYEISTLDESEREKVCKVCKDNIILSEPVTSTFVCEGSFCTDALDWFVDEVGESYFKRKSLSKKLKKVW